MELEQQYVWITTRTIAAGSHDEFSRAWRPEVFPAGMLRAYECYAPEREEVVGISVWDSREAIDEYKASEVEARRREAMAPFVIEESSGVYTARELAIPGRVHA